MLGAIIGDIVGSRFEWHNHRSKDFELFSDYCFFTDDSVMSVAVGKSLMDCEGDYTELSKVTTKNIRRIGKDYPHCGYGGMFYNWMFVQEDPKPYNSFGNGAAMRVSSCGNVGTSLEQVKELSRKVTEITHNHSEGIKGAEATAVAVFLAKEKYSIEQIKEHIENHYYPMNFTLDEIRDTYTFNETCQETVPQAIKAFLESTSFEDAIRNAISIGGDSDTVAAITGGIAGAYYGIPEEFKEKALDFLDEYLVMYVEDFEELYPNTNIID